MSDPAPPKRCNSCGHPIVGEFKTNDIYYFHPGERRSVCNEVEAAAKEARTRENDRILGIARSFFTALGVRV